MQPALGRVGGILECKKIAALAEAFNAQMAPHLYAGPVEWAANIQLGACIPNILLIETIETGFHSSLINNAIKVEDGHIELPTALGLGIELDEKMARENPYVGTALHLEMTKPQHSYSATVPFSGG